MAKALKSDFDLIVLKAEVLDNGQRVFDENFKDVKLTLECKVDGKLQSIRSWKTSTSELGLRDVKTTGKTSAVHLPHTVLKELRNWIDKNTERDRPLWVHLVKPYGLLRFFPWERSLGDCLKVPILMLPDFIFPRPREATAVLDVVLCGSAPREADKESIFQAISISAKKILEDSPRKTRLHIFLDQQLANAMKKQWHATNRLNVDVFVYDPKIAKKYVNSSRIEDPIDSLRSPWLLWIREALKGRSVDVVHFCCHGQIMRDQGILLFAHSPLKYSNHFLTDSVGVTELQTFLTQVGAWATVLTSTQDNKAESGLRALADAIAQSRPGPMMMQVMAHDPEGSALAEGYHFLFSTAPRPAPRSDALFIYCQPYLVSASTQKDYDTDYEDNLSKNSSLEPYLESKDLSDKAIIDGFKWAKRGVKHFAPKVIKYIAPKLIKRIPSSVTDKAIEHILPIIARNDAQIKEIMSVMNLNTDTLFEAYFKGENELSNLVASTERFTEQIQLRYQKLARDGLLPDELLKNQAEVAKKTLEQIRAVVSETLEAHEKGHL